MGSPLTKSFSYTFCKWAWAWAALQEGAAQGRGWQWRRAVDLKVRVQSIARKAKQVWWLYTWPTDHKRRLGLEQGKTKKSGQQGDIKIIGEYSHGQGCLQHRQAKVQFPLQSALTLISQSPFTVLSQQRQLSASAVLVISQMLECAPFQPPTTTLDAHGSFISSVISIPDS